MEIASYNQHAPFFRVLVSDRYQVYSVGGSRRRYLIKNATFRGQLGTTASASHLIRTAITFHRRLIVRYHHLVATYEAFEALVRITFFFINLHSVWKLIRVEGQ